MARGRQWIAVHGWWEGLLDVAAVPKGPSGGGASFFGVSEELRMITEPHQSKAGKER